MKKIFFLFLLIASSAVYAVELSGNASVVRGGSRVMAPQETLMAATAWGGVAKVTLVEASSMPQFVAFLVDTGMGTSCPAGTWLTWTGKGALPIDNAKTMLGVLLTALTSGKQVTLFGQNTCEVDFVHLHSQ